MVAGKKTFWRNLSVNAKLAISIALLTVLVVGIVAPIRSAQINRQVIAQIDERLESNTRTTSGIIEVMDSYTLIMLGSVANRTQVPAAISGDEDAANELAAGLQALLDGVNLVNAVQAYLNIFVTDASYNIVARASDDTASANYDRMISNKIRDTHNIGSPYISDFFVVDTEDDEDYNPQFLVMLPIIKEGELRGTVALLCVADILDHFLKEPTYYYDSFVNIADQNGIIFFSNRQEYLGLNVTELGVGGEFSDIPKEKTIRFTSAISGDKQYIYISGARNAWTIISYFDADSVENPAEVIFDSLFPTLIALMVSVCILLFVVYQELRTLKTLATCAKRIAKGDLNVHIEVRNNDEISQVSDSFLEIVSALEILRSSYETAQNALLNGESMPLLEDERLGGIFSEMLANTNNMMAHIQKAETSKYEAESVSIAKSEFLSKMSHEIRTPMNGIMGMADTILREPLPPAVLENMETLKMSGNHLLSIINDILDLSKVESGTLEISNEKYLFHTVIYDVVNIIRARMKDSRLNFAVYVQRTIPNELIGDEMRMRQIMLNLLSNAQKYTKQGYFSLEIMGEPSSENNAFDLTIRVKDTGVGIRKNDLEKLFTEFYRFDTNKNRNIEGTGLGLAITNNILELMGGTIHAESEYNVGSEFTVKMSQKLGTKLGRKLGVQAAGYGLFPETSVLVYAKSGEIIDRGEGVEVNPMIHAEYMVRCLKDLQVTSLIVKSAEQLRQCMTNGKWQYIFAEGDLSASARTVLQEMNITDCKIVMMTEPSIGRVETDDFITLNIPAYLFSIVSVLSGEEVVISKTERTSQVTMPDARVLIVDDVTTNLRVAAGLLNPFEMKLDMCDSGEEAIELVKQNDYDIVFMDQMMPEMDGIEATKIIRGLGDKYNALPIVALTANAIVGAREMFLQNGFNDFLTKPIDVSKLNALLLKWIPDSKHKIK